MHVSNFRAVKRVRDVVRVFARVRASVPATLVMVGDGPDRTDAEEEAHELGVEQDVRFLGRIDLVAPLLASADVFLLPSKTESFGLSALEALATGVPVVASNVGGLPEVVRDGETGFLCRLGRRQCDGRRRALRAHGCDPLAGDERRCGGRRACAVRHRPDHRPLPGAVPRRGREMTGIALWQAAVLGVLQGLAEFLPISSSAHLSLAPWAFGWPEPGLAFDVALHVGTLVAVLAYFREEWVLLARAAGRLAAERRMPARRP